MSKKFREVIGLSLWVCILYSALIVGILKFYSISIYSKDFLIVFFAIFINSLFVVITLYDSIKKTGNGDDNE